MDLKRYRVNNIQEALQLIKKDLGPEAVIVSTRQVKDCLLYTSDAADE